MQVIGMHIGSSFAELSVWNTDRSNPSPQSSAKDLFYLPRQNLKSALPKFLATLEQPVEAAYITCRFLERLFDFRLGGSTAQLLTAGFEAWPFLNGTGKQGWIHPAKALPIASQDLCFPVEERTEADGTLSKELDLTSLQPIVEKMKAGSVKRVCVHFLHSTKNPKNQNLAAEFLKEQGFEVFLPPTNGSPEGDRWRKSTLDASFSGTFEELKQDLETGFAGVLEPEKIFFADGQKFHPAESADHVAMLFGEDEILCAKQSSWILDLGLESWRLLNPKLRESWTSPWGPVAIDRPWRRDLRWQPTLSFRKNDKGALSPERRAEGYEPGPLSFGRGQKLFVYDLFADQLRTITGLTEQMPEAAASRRQATLTALARSAQVKDGPTLQKQLIEKLIQETVTEIKTVTGSETVQMTGLFAPLLREYLMSPNLKFDHPETAAERVARAGVSK